MTLRDQWPILLILLMANFSPYTKETSHNPVVDFLETVSVADESFDRRTVTAADVDDSARHFLKRGNMKSPFKAYSSDINKYSGSTVDNFDRKFMLFLDRCDQFDIAED